MAGFALTQRMAIKLIIDRRGEPARERVFDGEIVTIGSDPSASLALRGRDIAAEQAIILNEDGRLLFINRAEGTALNGETLAREARRPLADGDTLRIGSYTITLSLNSAAPPRAQDESAREEFFSPVVTPEAGTTATSAARPQQPQQQQQTQTPQQPSPQSQQQSQQQSQPSARANEEESRTGARSFASILDSLRTEEDSFYFQVEGARGRRRVAVETAEMMLGWDESGQEIACDAALVVAPRGVVRKDWSGVVVLALSAGMVRVNGEPVEAPRRLRNGDRLTLMPTATAPAADPERTYLVFHEPASLVVLDTLLPQQQLPPPVAPGQQPAPDASATVAAGGAANALAPRAPVVPARTRVGLFSPERRYFGYFTPGELLIMLCGTLVAAVVIFLILEFS